jgi:hypothetical protein
VLIRTSLLAAFAATVPATAQQPARWRLVEEWRVGGAVQGPHAFDNVRDIDALPGGRLIVLEGKDQQLHILGSGPGEFRGATGVAVAPDGSFIVNDNQNSRFTLFTASGDPIRTVTRPGMGAVSGPWVAQIDRDGRLSEFANVLRRLPDREFQSWPARRVWNADLSRADTTVTAECPNAPLSSQWDFAYRVMNANNTYWQAAYPWIRPSVREAPAGDGSYWTGVGLSYRRIHRTLLASCNPIAAVELGGSAIAIPRAVRAPYQAGLRRTAEGQGGNPNRPDPEKVPQALPPFEALATDAAGRLWVERFTGAGLHFGEGGSSTVSGERRFEVYSFAGERVAELAVPARVTVRRPVAITQDRLYAFVPDDDDVLHLVAFRIER